MRVAGEFEDSALLATFGAEGMGAFPAAVVADARLRERYSLTRVGDCTIDALRDACAISLTPRSPRAAEIDRSDQFPMDLWRKMGDLGVLGITAPEPSLAAAPTWAYLAHGRDGRDQPRQRPVGLSLRRAQQPVRQPDQAQRQRRAEAPNTCPN